LYVGLDPGFYIVEDHGTGKRTTQKLLSKMNRLLSDLG
jgi:hypothetical protein